METLKAVEKTLQWWAVFLFQLTVVAFAGVVAFLLFNEFVLHTDHWEHLWGSFERIT